ncbi:MAG: ribonuclease P protein component [Deltaproteobacteria bacterium]|nr:ribonuclease P protein component [Deltaproteobacteria bacterium]
MSNFSLKRAERIKKSAEFIIIYRKGARKESRHFKVAILGNNLSWSRLGITVGKKIGNSVQRNHVKRRIREYFRLHKALLPASSDIVFTAKTGADRLLYAGIASEIDRLFDAHAHEPESHLNE